MKVLDEKDFAKVDKMPMSGVSATLGNDEHVFQDEFSPPQMQMLLALAISEDKTLEQVIAEVMMDKHLYE